jgi:glycosyltransferase involved in cell wall biosynthesis
MPSLNENTASAVHVSHTVKFRSLPIATPAAKRLSTLQLGLGWFPEEPGGLERYYYDLLHALPQVNVGCHGLVIGTDVISNNTHGSVSSFAPASAPLIQRWKSSWRAVKGALETSKFDLIVSHFSLYTLPVLRLIKDRPLVVHFHGPAAAEAKIEGEGRIERILKYRFERLVYQRATKLIVLSSAFAKVLARDYRIDMDRIHVIPGGINSDVFDIPETRVQARGQLGWPTDRPIILCVRRLIRRMGLENLVDAAREIRRATSDVLILIVGRGPLEEPLAQRIRDKGLGDTIRLLGFVAERELRLAYRAADLTVVPSTALEGFGLAAAESLASGTPALVNPVGGLPSAVQGLSPDLVLSGVSQEVLSAGLISALRSSGALPSAKACRDHARDHFDWKRVSAQVRNVYCAALGA